MTARTRRGRALREPRVIVGAMITVAIVVLAVIGPWLAPHSETEFVGVPFAAPGSSYWLGTDVLGRDVFSRLLSGGRTILWVSVLAATLAMLIGVCAGLTAGYRFGWVDETVMRLIDLLTSVPMIVAALLVVSVFGSHLLLVAALLGVFYAPVVARLTRLLTIDIVSRDYVKVSRLLGNSRTHILLKDVVPNISTGLFVQYGLRLVACIASIAALSVLGFGVVPPAADWGLMINENRVGLSVQPWSVLGPVICIASFALGVNFLFDGISRSVSGVGAAQDRDVRLAGERDVRT